MKTTILSVLLCHSFAFSAYSQTTATLYSYFVIANNQLWALTGDEHLRLFDLKRVKRYNRNKLEVEVAQLLQFIIDTREMVESEYR